MPTTAAHTTLWIAFGIGILILLAIDVAVMGQRKTPIPFRTALRWTAVLIALALLFGAAIWWREGREPATQFASGYLIELLLSVDNLLVFLILLDYFGVPSAARATVLTWGILGAIVMRGIVIAGGALIINQLQWIVYCLAALLLFTGARMLRRSADADIDPERNPLLRLARRVLPVTDSYRGTRFVIRENGRWFVTPLLLVLIAIESTDLVFAADSIPAVFAVTRDPFLIYASNIFAVVGLRALYFVLSAALARFTNLRTGVAVVLLFVGAKMLLARVIAVPSWVTLLVVMLLLAISLVGKGEGKQEKGKVLP